MMANPVVVFCPMGEWTLVAQGISAGFVHCLNATIYLQTYRPTGGAAPTTDAEGAPMLPPGAIVSATDPIDVYVWTRGIPGSVRVDI